MVDFIADTEDLTEFVDQKVVEVFNNKEEEEVIKEAFFRLKMGNGHWPYAAHKTEVDKYSGSTPVLPRSGL